MYSSCGYGQDSVCHFGKSLPCIVCGVMCYIFAHYQVQAGQPEQGWPGAETDEILAAAGVWEVGGISEKWWMATVMGALTGLRELAVYDQYNM